MPPGLFIVLIVIGAAVALLFTGIRTAARALKKWLESPDEVYLPPASEIGLDCAILRFPSDFVPTVAASEVPLWQRYRYQEVGDQLLALNDELAIMMMMVSLLDLWQSGKVEISVTPPQKEDDGDGEAEIWMKQTGELPLSPLGRCWAASFKMATQPLWVFRKERSSAPLEDVVEFALREAKRSLGWKRARRSHSENLVLYVQEFVAKRNVPVTERDRARQLLNTVKTQHPDLYQNLEKGLRSALEAIKRIEPDRDPLSF